MCLGVEDPLIQVYFLMISEQQIQILERLAQEEGLHHVLGSCVQRIPHVADGGVASTHLAILLNALKVWIIIIKQDQQVTTTLVEFSWSLESLMLTWNICQPQSWYVLFPEK